MAEYDDLTPEQKQNLRDVQLLPDDDIAPPLMTPQQAGLFKPAGTGMPDFFGNRGPEDFSAPPASVQQPQQAQAPTNQFEMKEVANVSDFKENPGETLRQILTELIGIRNKLDEMTSGRAG